MLRKAIVSEIFHQEPRGFESICQKRRSIFYVPHCQKQGVASAASFFFRIEEDRNATPASAAGGGCSEPGLAPRSENARISAERLQRFPGTARVAPKVSVQRTRSFGRRLRWSLRSREEILFVSTTALGQKNPVCSIEQTGFFSLFVMQSSSSVKQQSFLRSALPLLLSPQRTDEY